MRSEDILSTADREYGWPDYYYDDEYYDCYCPSCVTMGNGIHNPLVKCPSCGTIAAPSSGFDHYHPECPEWTIMMVMEASDIETD